MYDAWSEKLYDYFYERMRPGCFDDCLAKNPDIVCTIDHDMRQLLGRTTSGTLKLKGDSGGLSIEVRNNGTTYANDLLINMRNRDINGMSFTFEIVTEDWRTEESMRRRDVIKANIFEVSFVSKPAYPDTTAGIRACHGTDKEREEVLRRARLAFDRPRVIPADLGQRLLRQWESEQSLYAGRR